MSAPLVVNTVDGAVWTRREGSRDGEALYAPEKCGTCPQFVMVTLTELAELGIVGSADVLPVPGGPELELALPWAHVMPDGDLGGFLDDLVSAALNRWRTDPDGPVPDRVTLADIERVCREWRTPGQGYRSDPEPEAIPDAVTKVFSPVASLREPEGEHWAAVHHSYRVPRDLPETGGVQ